MFTTLILIVAAVLGLLALHMLALWAERRGWIYYKHRKASPGTMSGAFLELQSLLEPGRKYVIETRTEDAAESDASGDPPPGQARNSP